MTKMKPILLRLPPELVARMDMVRGDTNRTLYIQRLIERAVRGEA